jgi:CHAT domain-containing protein/tetratricopeptide (TPR) repeat protein
VIVLLASLLLQATPPTSPDPLRAAREVQDAFDRGGGGAIATAWADALRQRPRDPRALFGAATVARLQYRYERADSLYLRIGGLAPGTAWHAAALLGHAQARFVLGDVQGADSAFEAARALAEAAGARGIEAEALLGLASVRQRTQGPAAAKALLARWWSALPAATAADSVQRLCGLGAVDEQLGDTTGLRRIGRGAEWAEQQGAWRLAGQCRLAFAQAADRRGYPSAAVGQARLAVAAFDRVGQAAGGALARQWLAFALLTASRFHEARRTYDEALRLAQRTRYAAVEGWIHTGLAELHLRLGELGDARRHAAVAAASHAARSDQWGLAVSRRFEALALRAAGDLSGAIARLADAQAAFAAAGLPYNSLPVLATRATLEMRAGLLDSAERTIAQGDRLGQGSGAWPDEARILRAELAMRRGDLARADSLLRATAPARKWRRGEDRLYDIEVAAREAQVAVRARNWPRADSALRAVTAALEAWRRTPQNSSIAASLAQLKNTWGDLGSAWPDLAAALVEAGRAADAFLLVEQVRARQLAERALLTAASADSASAAALLQRELAQRVRDDDMTALTALRRALAADEAFVSYVLGGEGAPSTALVVARDRVRAFTFPPAALLAPDIDRVLQLGAAGADPVAPGRRLAAAFLDPVMDSLPHGITRLVISPDGLLHRVPFDALRLRDGRYAVERAAVVVAPSATVWVALHGRPTPSGVRVIAVGNPTFRGVASGGSAPRRSAGTRLGQPRDWMPDPLAPLPFAGAEAARVGRYGREATVLRGAKATEAALTRQPLHDVAVLHLATHALVDPHSEQRTAIVLGEGDGEDGLLRPHEAAGLDLRGAVVVLSACRSSGGLVLAGEGMRGLVAPLLAAGAAAVVATHWAIGDRSVVPFVDRVYAAMARGARVDDALREAKLAAIRDQASFSDWASFTVVGMGSVRPPLRVVDAAPMPWQRTGAQGRRDSGGP